MTRYAVQLVLGFKRRPTRDEQAFLGELKARVQPFGEADLNVILDVEAADMVAALGQAKALVVDRLEGDLLTARIFVPGFELRPGSWWRRRRRQR